MGFMTRFCLVFYLVVLLSGMGFSPVAQSADRPIRVTFLSPSPPELYPFWNDFVDFLWAAAASLDTDLTVLPARDRFGVLDNARKVLSGPEKPDYIMYIYQAEISREVLRLAEEAGVKSLIVNTDIIPSERLNVGKPRKRFLQWIGHISPDDELASRHLTERLLASAKEMKLEDVGGNIHTLGIGADRETTAAIYREAGFNDVLRRHPEIVLDRLVLCKWDRKIARDKTALLLRIYPHTRMIWAVNDATAMGSLDAMREHGLEPGRDAVIGGIDWSPEGIEAVEEGEMVATIGGHFMDGGWGLVMLYDYHHGKDFAPYGASMRSQMRLLDRDNMQKYVPVLTRENWKKIDFRRFTQVHNPNFTQYDFSPDSAVEALSGQ